MIIFKVISLLVIGLNSINGFRIDVKKKNFVHLNDIQIDTNLIHDHLEDYEKAFLFGTNNHKPRIKFVHVTRSLKRETRSTTDDNSQPLRKNGQITFQLEDNGEQVNLKLQQTPKLIDDAFILINRYENTSQFISDSHRLAIDYEKCFYRSENSALDLCDDLSIRGIFQHNEKDFLIQPLPERFGRNTHIVIESSSRNHQNAKNNVAINLNKGKVNEHFEPEKDDFIDAKELQFNGQQNISIAPETIVIYSRVGNKTSSYSKLKINDDHTWRKNRNRVRRYIDLAPPVNSRNGSPIKVPQILHIETAIFVDKDLFKHMARNFPKNTESYLIRFVLTMVNGVQLLYHHPSLGHKINFVLKRLEILHSDPKDLRRSSDIDVYLNNFCMWQKKLNPTLDSDVVHYDHAVILTGLDLYVIDKNGKVSSQVVGLAPVAGMCTATSSCTINEGKHFESVFVVAHEIGHNLGMRHDTRENHCDSSMYIMSPTLGSGKITWSKCSRTYLNNFLGTNQAKCLFDRGQFSHSLDHSAEGLLPGERFDADKQCMLKYGKDSLRSKSQVLTDICQDLNCQRGRYTWTSHPALEGTECSEMMWCRSGVCVIKTSLMESYAATVKKIMTIGKSNEKVGFIGDRKNDQLLKPDILNWSNWTKPSACESGCLFGESGRLKEGSTGLKTYTRTCLDYKRRCVGKNRKFETCAPKQCYKIDKITVEEFATQICERAKKFDTELLGNGIQIVGQTVEESCRVYCKTKQNATKSRSWTFPDGTTCHTKFYNVDDQSFCINGRCELFSCDNSTNNYYKFDQALCPQNDVRDTDEQEEQQPQPQAFQNYQENGRDYKSIKVNGQEIKTIPTKPILKDIKLTRRNFHQPSTGNFIKRKSDPYQHWQATTADKTTRSSLDNLWTVKSGCHYNCIDKAKGVQVVNFNRNNTNNIQLCEPTIKPCDRIQTTTEYAKSICARYKLKVRGLSGFGMQIASSVKDPDRSCRIACQDEILPARFYLVNGQYGMFPFGTKCSNTAERYCISGKCLEFDSNEIPLQQSHLSLALFRNKRNINLQQKRNWRRRQYKQRQKRSFNNFLPVKITENVTQSFIDDIVNDFQSNIRNNNNLDDFQFSNDHIEFFYPIHISSYDELNYQ